MNGKTSTLGRTGAREPRHVVQPVTKRPGHSGATRVRSSREALADLRQRARSFNRTRRGAQTLLKHLVIAEIDGVDAAALAAVRRDIGERVTKRLDEETARATERSIREVPLGEVTPELARELREQVERIARDGNRGTPHEVVWQEVLDDMAAELRALARAYSRTGRGATQLLEYLTLAENDGADARALGAIRRALGTKARRSS